MRNECTVLEKLRASVFLLAASCLLMFIMLKVGLELQPLTQEQIPLWVNVLGGIFGIIWLGNFLIAVVISGVFAIQAVIELIHIQLGGGYDW